MIRRPIAVLLSFVLALSSVPTKAQSVAGNAATNAVPRVTVSFGGVLSAPSISALPGAGSAPSLSNSLLPSIAPSVVPAPAPSALAVSVNAAASIPTGPFAVKPTAGSFGAQPASLKTTLVAPSLDARTAAEIEALKLAWRSARALVEPVPGAPDTLADAPVHDAPAREYTASPEDWRDELLHFVLVDRFARAGKARTHGDPKDGGSRHGGNLRGIIEQLDYIKGSGVTALLLSPVTQNQPASYHGYASVHLMAIDPHLGTMADFKELVNEAHKRGLKVVLDWGINHAGPVFEYKEGSQWRGLEGHPKEIGEWTETLKPSELMDAKHFTRRGVIDDWNDKEQSTHGDFPPNYRHFASDKKETGDALIHIAKWFIQETDIDGFRVDAVRHVAPGFVPVFASAVKDYAASLGKKNFFLVGEDSTGVDAELVPQLTTNKMDSVFAYPAYRRETYALHGKAPTQALENSFLRTAQALGPLASRLLRFIDNHDVYRFLRLGEPEAQLKVALAYLLFSIGIPMTYYGTEQGFRQDTDRLDPEGPDHPADPRNREDQFEGGEFKSESSAGDKFDPENAMYQWTAKLTDVRKEYAALRRGEQWVRWSDQYEAGVFAFSRLHEGQEAVVVLNFSQNTRAADMWVDASATPAGTQLKDALHPDFRPRAYATGGGSKIQVSMPPMSVRVLVRDAQ